MPGFFIGCISMLTPMAREWPWDGVSGYVGVGEAKGSGVDFLSNISANFKTFRLRYHWLRWPKVGDNIGYELL